jgi:hypothetical protein
MFEELEEDALVLHQVVSYFKIVLQKLFVVLTGLIVYEWVVTHFFGGWSLYRLLITSKAVLHHKLSNQGAECSKLLENLERPMVNEKEQQKENIFPSEVEMPDSSDNHAKKDLSPRLLSHATGHGPRMHLTRRSRVTLNTKSKSAKPAKPVQTKTAFSNCLTTISEDNEEQNSSNSRSSKATTGSSWEQITSSSNEDDLSAYYSPPASPAIPASTLAASDLDPATGRQFPSPYETSYFKDQSWNNSQWTSPVTAGTGRILGPLDLEKLDEGLFLRDKDRRPLIDSDEDGDVADPCMVLTSQSFGLTEKGQNPQSEQKQEDASGSLDQLPTAMNPGSVESDNASDDSLSRALKNPVFRLKTIYWRRLKDRPRRPSPPEQRRPASNARYTEQYRKLQAYVGHLAKEVHSKSDSERSKKRLRFYRVIWKRIRRT